MDCSPLVSSVHGISQSRILDWVVISFCRGSSWLSWSRDHLGSRSQHLVFYSISRVWLFVIPRTREYEAPLFSTISQSLLKFISIESVMPSSHLILCCVFSSCLQSFPASGSFPMTRLFAAGGQSIGVAASASVLPMNIQDWLVLGLTGLISLQSKGPLTQWNKIVIHTLYYFEKYSFSMLHIYSLENGGLVSMC